MPETSITLTNLAAYAKCPSLLINLGQTVSLNRVVVCGTNNGLIHWLNPQANASTIPLGLVVIYVGNNPKAMSPVAYYPIPYDAGNPIDQPMDIRFSPTNGQYLKLELQTHVNWPNSPYSYNTVYYGWPNVTSPSNQMWRISEVEIYGSTNTIATDAVVLPVNAAPPLVLAANELSYYLSELSGRPHPIITPAQTNNYAGTLYTIVDLKSLAPDYQTMTNNIARGVLPINEVNVTANGRVVAFSGWPYRCVLWSVWEFLERQGVVWAYPDVHGDYVPARGSVDLTLLPLKMQATAQNIRANFDLSLYNPWPDWVQQCQQQGALFFWRSRWTSAWNPGPLGGAEIPIVVPTGSIPAQYAEGFGGYPHNMSEVMPDKVLANNPDWWGSADGVTYSPTAAMFCLANTNAAAWIAQKVLAWDAYAPPAKTRPLDLGPLAYSYNLLPIDSVQFSLDKKSVAANALYGGPATKLPFATGNTHSGGAYYKLLTTIANICTNQLIGGLAYADVFDPPKSNYPPNVQMDVCLYGSPNTSFDSPANADMKAALTTWRQRCSKIATYAYDLLFVDVWQPDPRLPVPMISALVDRSKYLASIGAQNGSTQALLGQNNAPALDSLIYNAWDFYAWPRSRWNTNITSDKLINDYFTGCFKEAAGPMTAYYKAMDNHQFSNNVNMHYFGYCYWIMPGSFPIGVLNEMRTNLLAAQTMATNWHVINRLNDVNTSFQWLLNQCGITNASMLTNYSAYPTVPASGTYTLALNKFSNFNTPHNYYYDAAWNEYGWGTWNFNGAAIIKQTLNFPQAGLYRVDVACRSRDFGLPGVGQPALRVYLGGQCSNTEVITSSVTTTNSYFLNVPTPTPVDLTIAQDVPNGLLVVSQVRVTRQ